MFSGKYHYIAHMLKFASILNFFVSLIFRFAVESHLVESKTSVSYRPSYETLIIKLLAHSATIYDHHEEIKELEGSFITRSIGRLNFLTLNSYN